MFSHQKWFRTLFRRRVQIILLLLFQLVFLLYIIIGGTRLSGVISTILTLVSFAAVMFVVRKREKGAYKISWIILMLALPLFGGILYIFTEIQTHNPSLVRREKEALKKSAPLKRLPGAVENAGELFPEYKPEFDYLDKFAGFPVFDSTEITYLSPGEAKLAHLLEELEKAEKYIFMEYFIFQDGKMWDAILDVLKRKAASGVKVRIIYDDFGCFFLLPDNYPAILAKMGIECKIFNPFRPFLTVVQNNRDHRKIASIDGKVVFTGGINIADEYVNAIELHGHWKDASVMLRGKAAWSMTLMFLEMWQVASGADEDFYEYYPWKDASRPAEVSSESDKPLEPNELSGTHGALESDKTLETSKSYKTSESLESLEPNETFKYSKSSGTLEPSKSRVSENPVGHVEAKESDNPRVSGNLTEHSEAKAQAVALDFAGEGLVEPYADSPMDSENVGEHVYLQLIERAKRYVYITTPYLIIDDSMISALTLAAKSGVDVRIITPHIWDKRFVHETTRSYYAELISAGVRVYEYSPGFIHSKTFVSDDFVATVGTANLDFRSLYMHYECGVRFYNCKAVTQMRDDFLETIEKCMEIKPEDCRTSPLKYITQNVLRLIAPLM